MSGLRLGREKGDVNGQWGSGRSCESRGSALAM